MMQLTNSPVTEHQFNDHHFYLKRDDWLHTEFSGNKARKFMALLERPAPNINTLISYGSAQSNALYSLAALAKLKGWQLEFYTARIPAWLQANPIGNYQAALALGAQVIDLSQLTPKLHAKDYIAQIRQPDEHCLYVPEGGYSSDADYGIKQLAQEILNWQAEQNINELTVALPSGTGTTALYLNKYLQAHAINVITCACVGGHDYLSEQFEQLDASPAPTILSFSQRPKHQFAHLYQQDYQLWRQLKQQTQVEFDLLYDPYMWHCLQEWLPHSSTLLYIHQGGLLGNESMLKRYQRKYP